MSNYIIKLTSGESIYGKIKSVKDDKMVIVSDALTWEEFINEEGYSCSSLVKYCSGSDERDVPIAKTAIVSIAGLSQDFSDFYEAAVQVSRITEESYTSRLKAMTVRMLNKVQEHRAMEHQQKTGQIVAYKPFSLSDTLSDTDIDTLH